MNGFPIKRVPQDFVTFIQPMECANDKFRPDIVAKFLTDYCTENRYTSAKLKLAIHCLTNGGDKKDIADYLQDLSNHLDMCDAAFTHGMNNVDLLTEYFDLDDEA